MVENWELEWNSSMIQHGRDLGTMNFIFAKGGDLSDMNYVLFDVQDNSWEPLIKAVAERDNSHPDIIRKNATILYATRTTPFNNLWERVLLLQDRLTKSSTQHSECKISRTTLTTLLQ